MFIYTVQHLSKRITKSKRLFNKDGGSDVLQKQQYIDMDMEVPWWAIPQEDNKKISKTKQEEVRVTRKTKLPKQ